MQCKSWVTVVGEWAAAGEKLSESSASDVRQLCTTLLNCYLIQARPAILVLLQLGVVTCVTGQHQFCTDCIAAASLCHFPTRWTFTVGFTFVWSLMASPSVCCQALSPSAMAFRAHHLAGRNSALSTSAPMQAPERVHAECSCWRRASCTPIRTQVCFPVRERHLCVLSASFYNFCLWYNGDT